MQAVEQFGMGKGSYNIKLENPLLRHSLEVWTWCMRQSPHPMKPTRLSEQPISLILTQMRAVQENLSEKQRLAGDARYH